jgi:hypothetical protein
MIELLRAAARQICSAAFINEERITREQFVVSQKANTVGAMPRCVQNLDLHVANRENISIVHGNILLHMGQSMRYDLSAAPFPNVFIASSMVTVTVRIDNVLHMKLFVVH